MDKIKSVLKGEHKSKDQAKDQQVHTQSQEPTKDTAPKVSRSEPSEIHDASLNQIHEAEEKERRDRMQTDQELAKENANKLAHMVDENTTTQQ